MTRWFKIGGLVALGALAAELAVAVPFGRLIGQFVAWMQAAGMLGVLAYAAVYMTATVFVLPGSVLSAGAGLAYGPWLGVLLVSPVSVAAATLAFTLGRTVARGWVTRRMERDRRFRAIDAAVSQRGFQIVALLRLSPVFPFNVLNYALALTGVRLRDYVLGSFVGMLPGTFLYVYLGSLVRDVAELAAGTSGGAGTQYLQWAGLAATVAVTVYITRVARRALRQELDRHDPGGVAHESSR
jgi:uncharacterized membrane protein YdjX (TVP38/TMEM64 family)